MIEEEQERYLDEGIKSVKAQAYQIHNAIDRNNMRQCLRESAMMLNELKTGNLTPKYYYSLYMGVFDEMQYVYNFFKEEARRGRRMKDFYDTVQQAQSIIPRLYLMITAGAVYIESQNTVSKDIIFDLLEMVKGVQNPTRGLFTRYYLLKMLKDKVPDKGNEFETAKASINDTLHFILQNLEEMNRLWIRLSTGTNGPERIIREKERNELKILVGENIVRLSLLDGLTLDMYQNEILPRIINILLESKDQLSQQYLMECIIHAFPDEYNIQCMQKILETSTQLNQNVDVKSLFIALMDKLAKFVGDSGKDEKEILEAAEKIFDLLKQSIDTLTQQGCSQDGGVSEPIKLVELQLAFMKFTVKCCPAKDKLDTINHILSCTYNILTSYNKKLNQEGVNLLRNLLTTPLESELSLFDFQQFPELMVYLDFNCRTTLALKIIQSLNNKEKLDSTEKVSILLGFIRPLLEDSADTIEVDPMEFEYEQNTVAKMLFVISTNDPIKLIEILVAIIPIFSKGGNKRIRYTLPTLANAFIQLANQVCAGFENKGQQLPSDSTGVHQAFVNHLDMKAFESEEYYEKFLLKIHTHISEIINTLLQPYPEIAFQLYLTASLQANTIKTNEGKFAEIILNYLKGCLSIYNDSQVNQDNKINLLTSLMGTLLQLSTLSAEAITPLVNEIQQLCLNMVKRADQCNSILCCSNLYYTLLGNKGKANECLKKAKRFSDFAMTKPEHLILFVYTLNKYIYFIENIKDDDYFFSKDDIDDVIETIKNHIQTIRTEGGSNATFLPAIEKYFNSTIETIQKRRLEKQHKFYDEISI